MTLRSYAHIKLGNDEFQLDRSIEGHYQHKFTPLEIDSRPIVGMPSKQNLKPNSLYWAYDDWAGGEGDFLYYPEDFDRYNVGHELNPRIRGLLTGRPNRQRATVTARYEGHKPMMAVSQGAGWIGGSQNLAYFTTDPTSWTDKATSATPASDKVGLRSLSADYKMTALIGDNDYVYYSGWHSGTGGSRVTLQAIKSDSAVAVTVETEATGKPPFADLAIMNGKLYCWTGRKLYEFDIDQSMPLAADKRRKVFDTRVDPSSSNVFGTTWWAEAKATENSIIMWYSNDGQAEVYEYKKGVGRPIWRPPYGFSIKGSIYEQGIMYFTGHWGGDESADGHAEVWALPLTSYSPTFIASPRKLQGTHFQMKEMAGSYGEQVIMGAWKKGYIFVYDAEADGLTMLDDLTRASGSDPDGLTFIESGGQHRLGGMITKGPWRLCTIYDATSSAVGTYQVVAYDEDEPPSNRETGLNTTNYTGLNAYFETPSWDFDYPMEVKSLTGFHVSFEPLVSGMTMVVSYSLDGAAFVDLAAITSATTGNATGRVYQQVSTSSAQKQFNNLRYRVTLTSATAVLTPILYSVTAEAKLTRKRQTWELILRVKDEMSRNRPSSRKVDGAKIRDWIETTIESGNVVTLQDGYRYKDMTPGRYTTHSVFIREATDIISEPGEGSCRIILEAVDE